MAGLKHSVHAHGEQWEHKEGTGKVRSRISYASKRKRGEQSDRAPVDLPRALISRFKASILLMAG